MTPRTQTIIFAVAIIIFSIAAAFGIALNVSKDVTYGYVQSGNAVHRSNENIRKIVDDQYADFYSDSTNMDEETLKKTRELQRLTENTIRYIQEVRYEMICFVDGREQQSSDTLVPYICSEKLIDKTNWDKTTYFMLGQNDQGQECCADLLKKKIDEYKNAIIQLVDKNEQYKMKLQLDFLNTDSRGEISWQEHHFSHSLEIVAATELDAIINDVITAEYICLKNLTQQKL